jgi:DNA-binding PucR family transcriptional regulator
MHAATDESMRELAGLLAQETDRLGAELAAFVLQEVPAYRELDSDEIRAVTVTSGRVNVGAILSMLQFGIRPETIRQPAGAVDFAHAMIHRGVDLATILRTYRLGHDRLWDTWIAFIAERLDDPAVLAAVTRRSSALMFAYFDAVGQDIAADYDVERERWLRSAAAVRDAAVEQILDGTATDAEQAGLTLRHELRRHHVAFIVWSADAVQAAALAGQAELVAGAVAGALDAGQPLVVRPSAAALWGWASRFEAVPGDLEQRLAAVGVDGLLVAVGSAGWGIEGFRESHAQAREAQRVARLAQTPAAVTTYRSVALASALCADAEVARRFSRSELGPLDATTVAAGRLRDTLTAYFEEGNSPVRAARRLGVHEKTVVYRVRKAEELLGHPVAGRRAELELALRVRLLLGDTR